MSCPCLRSCRGRDPLSRRSPVFVAAFAFWRKYRGLDSGDHALPFWVAIFSRYGVLGFAEFTRADGCDLKGRVTSSFPATCKGYLNST
ncbi:hypothetical protein L195_g049680 [Trifolium pratense]|uniref:Uncharacterized protein n=1 Tax=Trifolium pratense TaxID=57577 RepID=A0A2K3JPT0_TRIPR|nr:hypothetical protein L195_g049680 [Trifolium pratense]